MPVRSRQIVTLFDCSVAEAPTTNEFTITLPDGLTLAQVAHMTGTVQFSASGGGTQRVELDKLLAWQIFIPVALGLDNVAVPLRSGGASFPCLVISPAPLGTASAVSARMRNCDGAHTRQAPPAVDIPINVYTLANVKCELL